MSKIDYKNYRGFLDSSPEEVAAAVRGYSNVMLTEGLFEETIHPNTRANGVVPLYTLREFSTDDKPSAYQIYMHSVDETEAALKLVGSLNHWRKLCSINWFINGRNEGSFPGINQWRADMAARDALTAKKVLLKQVSEGNLNAAKALNKQSEDDLKKSEKSVPRRRSAADVSDDKEIADFLQAL